MAPILYVYCCQVWPIVFGVGYGRCGRCGRKPARMATEAEISRRLWFMQDKVPADWGMAP